jgi:hypothetical protein
MPLVPWPDQRPCDPVLWHWPYSMCMIVEGFKLLLPQDARVYVELGTFTGASAQVACRLAPHAHIICVDTWDGRGSAAYNAVAHRSLALCQANLWTWRHRVSLIQATSTEGLCEIAAAKLEPDLVFIDADHEYAHVHADIDLTKTLFPNTRICGDDWSEPDVFHAAIEHFPGLVGCLGTSFWWAIQNHPEMTIGYDAS